MLTNIDDFDPEGTWLKCKHSTEQKYVNILCYFICSSTRTDKKYLHTLSPSVATYTRPTCSGRNNVNFFSQFKP